MLSAPPSGKIDMDDDLTMLIGPAHDGTLLEIGVLDLNGEDPVVIHAMRLRPNPIRMTTGLEATAASARQRWPEATIEPLPL